MTRGTAVFSYDYDQAGNVTRRTYPDGTVVDYGYDDDGRMQTVTAGGATTTYAYLPGGLLDTTTLPAGNGYVEDRDYDRAGRLESLVNAKNGVVLSEAHYTYDATGNPTRGITEDETVHYTYDPRNMLTLACYSGPTCDTDGATADDYYGYATTRSATGSARRVRWPGRTG